MEYYIISYLLSDLVSEFDFVTRAKSKYEAIRRWKDDEDAEDAGYVIKKVTEITETEYKEKLNEEMKKIKREAIRDGRYFMGEIGKIKDEIKLISEDAKKSFVDIGIIFIAGVVIEEHQCLFVQDMCGGKEGILRSSLEHFVDERKDFAKAIFVPVLLGKNL